MIRSHIGQIFPLPCVAALDKNEYHMVRVSIGAPRLHCRLQCRLRNFAVAHIASVAPHIAAVAASLFVLQYTHQLTLYNHVVRQ